ncbi:hypothetical protein HRbin28_02210 [bacterium HR28]|nr:hypothetical protein HRbin28_02210 [bacterium HR28]
MIWSAIDVQRGPEVRDPVLEALQLIEVLHAHEDGIRTLDPKGYRRTLRDLERALREAFPSYQDRIPEIVAALQGGKKPLPPRWWEGGWQMTTPSPEEILLSVFLGQRDPRYLPEDALDPLADAYREYLRGSELPSPESPVLFGLSLVVDALLWGFHRFRLYRNGRLVGMRELLRERFAADEALVDGLALLSRRCEEMGWEQRLAAFLALPGAAQLLDQILTLYGDLLVAKGVERTPVLPPAPVPERETPWFRRRLLQVYATVGHVGFAARALRIRKARASALIREMEAKDGKEAAA